MRKCCFIVSTWHLELQLQSILTSQKFLTYLWYQMDGTCLLPTKSHKFSDKQSVKARRLEKKRQDVTRNFSIEIFLSLKVLITDKQSLYKLMDFYRSSANIVDIFNLFQFKSIRKSFFRWCHSFNEFHCSKFYFASFALNPSNYLIKFLDNSYQTLIVKMRSCTRTVPYLIFWLCKIHVIFIQTLFTGILKTQLNTASLDIRRFFRHQSTF